MSADPAKADPAASGAVPEDEEITVGGAVLDGYVNVSEARLQLVAAIGEATDGRKVIVPFVDVDLVCTRGSEGVGGNLKGMLAFDNAAFIVDEFAEALAGIASQLEDLSKGELAPHGFGIDYALARIRQARSSLDEAAASLLRLSAPRHEPDASEAAGSLD